MYSIDTSSLINCGRYYPKKIFSSMWENIEELINEDVLKATICVYEEIKRQDDDLFDWVKKYKNKMFIDHEEDIQKQFNNLLRNPDCANKILNATKDEADPYVVALAKSRKYTVITEETLKNNKIKIPYMCSLVKVKYINFLEFLTQQNWVY